MTKSKCKPGARPPIAAAVSDTGKGDSQTMSQKEILAELSRRKIRMSPESFRTIHWRGRGPKCKRVGGRLLYYWRDVQAWLDKEHRAPESPDSLSVSGLAARSNVSKSGIYGAIDRGKLQAGRNGRRLFISLNEAFRWMRGEPLAAVAESVR
jgi:hypothetical protein